MADDIRTIWQTPGEPPRPPTADELAARSGSFERTIWWRNAREYGAAVLVVAFFGWQAIVAEHAGQTAGHALIVAGTLFVVWQLGRRGAARPVPAAAAADGVSFLCAELERQRDLLRSIWWWYLAPLVPGLVVLFVDGGVRHGSWRWTAARLAGTTVFFGAIGLVNVWAARGLDREATALRASAR